MFFEGETVDERHRPVGGPPYGATDEVSFDLLRINHYTTRSEAEFRRKLARPTADGLAVDPGRREEEAIARFLNRLDEIDDQSILMYVAALRAAV